MNSAQTTEAWPFDLTTLSAPDGSITARFVSLGATMTELWVKDRAGKDRDVVLGYDDNKRLLTDPAHPIVGRYANRIKKGTFSIPITKDPSPESLNVYQISRNDNNDQNTLHGGINGWDRKNWTIVEKSSTSVTYKHIDPADEGFPGIVTAFTTHTVSNGGKLETKIHATATELTPIMLTQHIYWNLDAYQDGTADILDHHLQLDASKVLAVDDSGIPTGEIIQVEDTVFDFRSEQKIGARWDETMKWYSSGCEGYNHCWIYDDSPGDSKTKTSLWSDKSGIKLDIATNQPAVQVYTAYWLDTPRKEVHGGPSAKYSKSSAVAIEQQSYVDAINKPEWGVDQIYGPGRDYVWYSTYTFSVVS